MFIKKKAFFLFVFLVILLVNICILLTSCGRTEDASLENDEKSEMIQIGLSFDSFFMERWERERDVFISAAKEAGANVNVQNANGSLKEQERQIQYFIDKKMDVIVVVAVDGNGLSEVVQKAREAKIPMVAYDRMLCNVGADLYVAFDNEEAGRQMAYAMREEEPAIRNVIMLCGPESDYGVLKTEQGFCTVMQANRVNILDKQYLESWTGEEAADYIESHTELVKRADAVMCENDSIATTVIRTLSENRLAGIVKVAGQDADLEACQRIAEGTQLVTVYKPVEELAKKAALACIELAQGKNPGMEQVFDGQFEIPAVILRPVAVSKRNLYDVIIKSGFHSMEDVYLNIPKK